MLSVHGAPERAAAGRGLKIVCVCTGNTCRSPMAAALSAERLAAGGRRSRRRGCTPRRARPPATARAAGHGRDGAWTSPATCARPLPARRWGRGALVLAHDAQRRRARCAALCPEATRGAVSWATRRCRTPSAGAWRPTSARRACWKRARRPSPAACRAREAKTADVPHKGTSVIFFSVTAQHRRRSAAKARTAGRRFYSVTSAVKYVSCVSLS